MKKESSSNSDYDLKVFKLRIYPDFNNKKLMDFLYLNIRTKKLLWNLALNETLKYQEETKSLMEKYKLDKANGLDVEKQKRLSASVFARDTYSLFGENGEIRKNFPCLNYFLGQLNSRLILATVNSLKKAFKSRANSKFGKPKFKRKRENTESFSFGDMARSKIDFRNLTIDIPTSQSNKNVYSCPFRLCGYQIPVDALKANLVRNVTFSKTTDNKWYVSFQVYVKKEPVNIPKNEESIAYDVGQLGLTFNKPLPENIIRKIKKIFIEDGHYTEDEINFAFSDPYRIYFPKFKEKEQKRIAKLSTELVRKREQNKKLHPDVPFYKSKRYQRKRIELAKLHQKILNRREHFQHIVTKLLTDEFGIIAREDLSIKDQIQRNKTKNKNGKKKISKTLKNRRVHARIMADNAIYEFNRKIDYKQERKNHSVIEVDRYFPSSQKCSCCGYIYHKMKDPKIKTFVCPKCGTVIDRDVNASINIYNEALKDKEDEFIANL